MDKGMSGLTFSKQEMPPHVTLSQVDGLMSRVAVGEGQVWGLTQDGALWVRAGLGPGTPMGTNWFRLQVRGW